MNTLEIRQCLETLELDAELIQQFLDVLTLVRSRASNGHTMAGLRLQELLSEAVCIGSVHSSRAMDISCAPEEEKIAEKTTALNQALEDQISKARASLKKFM